MAPPNLPARSASMELLHCVRRTLRRHALTAPGTRVLAAVSGGSDSVALAHILDALDRAGELRLAGLAHFNHQLRPAADSDERFSARLAAALGRSFVADRGDVAALAQREHRSIEDAARTARYAFLERARTELGADVVALGHTRDDQAETFLLRLIRGAGPRGLASMYPRHDRMIRPLLECRRHELQGYLNAHHVAFVRDESNDDVSISRNRVRAELLPLLANRFNPAIVDVLSDEAELARDEHQFLESAADELWSRVGPARPVAHEWRLSADGLAEAPAAVCRVLLRRAMEAAAGGRPVRFADVERARELLAAGGPPFDGPGQRVQRIGADLVLTSNGAAGRPQRDRPFVNFFRYSLSIPGQVRLEETGDVVSAELADRVDTHELSQVERIAWIRLDACPGPLAVRNRRPGDRFRPLGLGGRKKLQDFFVDRKVAREHRDRVPIVVDAADRIVWVAGHSIDEEFRVTDPVQSVIILRLKGVGGSD